MLNKSISPKAAVIVITTAVLAAGCFECASIRASERATQEPHVLNLASDCTASCHTDLQLAKLMKKKDGTNDPKYIPRILREIAADRAKLKKNDLSDKTS